MTRTLIRDAIKPRPTTPKPLFLSSKHPSVEQLSTGEANRPRSPGWERFSSAVGHLKSPRRSPLRSHRGEDPMVDSSASSRMSSPASLSPAPRPKLPAFLRATGADITRKFIDLEWKQRHRLAIGAQETQPDQPQPRWLRPSSQHVLERNRYLDIDPWESNRIKLPVPDGENDYINASPINMKSTKTKSVRRFIATQGPKYCSLDHFWQMIWQETEETAVIVMLTQTYEAGREKCIAYFPDGEPGTALEIGESTVSDSDDTSRDEDDAKVERRSMEAPGFQGTVELQSTEYVDALRSTERTMLLHVGDKTKSIHHYLFAGWPDFSVPEAEDRSALLELVKVTAAKASSSTNPRVVHCSAGVGRSGTFIALDYLIHELSEGSMDVDRGRDPIADCVDELRKQRMMMVQGDTQYALLYSIMKEQWLERHGQAESLHAKKSKSAMRSEERVDGVGVG